jgi:hypothetical protein
MILTINKVKVNPDTDRISEEIEKSEKHFKLAMMIVLLIVSLAAAMIFISLISSL